MASAALWAARAVVGKDILDKAIWKAIITFTMSTTFDEAATSILDELKKVAPSKEAQVKKIFQDRGFLGCVRVRDHKDISGAGRGPGYPGTSSGISAFAGLGWVPGFLQYKVKVAATTKELTITYRPVSGGMFGVGGTKGDVSIALKKGSTPIAYTYKSSVLDTKDYDMVLKGVDDGNGGYKLIISGSCLAAGDLIYQYINNGAQDGTISAVTITQSATKTNTTDNYVTCK